MDISQLTLTVVVFVGLLVVGLVAIVPTVLELPGGHDGVNDPARPLPLRATTRAPRSRAARHSTPRSSSSPVARPVDRAPSVLPTGSEPGLRDSAGQSAGSPAGTTTSNGGRLAA